MKRFIVANSLKCKGKSVDKQAQYQQVEREIISVLDGEDNHLARMVSVACLLNQAFEAYFWTGFYLVDKQKGDELVVGPYQGTLGCLRIRFGRGVCGVAAETQTTQIVADVHDFPGHIACDSRSNSEIVVPCFDAKGDLWAVFDVDSESKNSFDEIDKYWLERILHKVFA